MNTHDLKLQSEDADNILFMCADCNKVIGFNKPGIGEPSATADQIPDEVDAYIGACPGAAAPKSELQELRSLVGVLATAVLGGFDTAQLVADGKLTAAQRKKLVDIDAATKAEATAITSR